jgi:hypothetical protein
MSILLVSEPLVAHQLFHLPAELIRVLFPSVMSDQSPTVQSSQIPPCAPPQRASVQEIFEPPGRAHVGHQDEHRAGDFPDFWSGRRAAGQTEVAALKICEALTAQHAFDDPTKSLLAYQDQSS